MGKPSISARKSRVFFPSPISATKPALPHFLVVTLVVIGVFAVLALRGDISADNVMIIVSSVIAFYFGTQHEGKVAPVLKRAAEEKRGDGEGV